MEERFLTRAMAAGLAVYAAFAVTFATFQVKGDAAVYFNLLRRFFGEHPDFAFAYQFGSDVWNWPFFLVGKGLGAIFGFEPHIFHVSFEEISITVATNAAFVLILYLSWRLLKELGLPRGPAVLLGTTFGTPLFYYVVFEPAAKHTVDTLVLTAASLVLLLLLRGGTDKNAVILGTLAGVSLNIRYVNVAFFAAFAVALGLRYRRALFIALPTAAVVGLTIFVLPALRGISYFVPSYFPKSQAARFAAGLTSPTPIASTSNPLNGFDALIPFKMLFSDHRGLFVWTPLTAVAVVGYLLLLRRVREPRPFLWTLLGAAIALLLIHTIWGQWDGGFSFSTRFLTGLFPLFVIGIAELRRRIELWLIPILAVCIAWSLALGFTHYIGYDGISERDGAARLVSVIVHRHADLRKRVDARGDERWTYLWGLVRGQDPEHVHGP
jgi:hypothetical protein